MDIRSINRTFLFVIFMAFAASVSYAAPGDQLIAQVKGRIKINSDGAVSEVSFANVKSADLNRFLETQIKKWEFHPMLVNGQPVNADAGFNFRVLANFDGAGKLKNIAFQDVIVEPTQLELDAIKAESIDRNNARRFAPEYPYLPLTKGVEAEVKVAINVLPDGSISEAAVREMALLGVDRYVQTAQLTKFQNDFSNSATTAIKKWRFNQSSLSKSDCLRGCVAEILVTYEISNAPWKRYRMMTVPSIPWLIAEQVKDVDGTKSQLVRFKEQPSNQPIEIGG